VARTAGCFAESFWDLHAAKVKLQAQSRTGAMLKCRTRVTSFQIMVSIHGKRDRCIASALFLSRWKKRNSRFHRCRCESFGILSISPNFFPARGLLNEERGCLSFELCGWLIWIGNPVADGRRWGMRAASAAFG
jgi:hypothetical protein